METERLKQVLIDEIVRRIAEGTTFTVQIVEEEEGGYSAFVKELPGCMTQGDTREELDFNLEEAVTGYLECLAEEAIEGDPQWQDILASAADLPLENLVNRVQSNMGYIPAVPEDKLEGFVAHAENYRLPVEAR